jgi:type IV pilus assembly protein PilC
MLFKYRAIEADGHEREGTIEALSRDVAVAALQRRNLIISAIDSAENKSVFNLEISIFERVKNKDVVILSRQIATLFEAQVSALRIFRLLSGEVENKFLARVLATVADDIQGGSPISAALKKHPKVFSPFYVNMVRAGEETGKLSETFLYLADYLDRSYEVMSKASNALVYPAFVIGVFIVVMVLMFLYVIPQISAVLIDSGQELPIYTKIVLGISTFFVRYGIFLLMALLAGGAYVWRLSKTPSGKIFLDTFKVSVPYLGTLYQKLYLARISDNMATMLISGVAVVDAIDITGAVVGNAMYSQMLKQVAEAVKAGSSISDALAGHKEAPRIMVAMVKVGEETGELGKILSMLAKFYNREVSNAVDTLIGLIEPAMIVTLGVGVSVLLASVLLPIYNLTQAI